MTLGSYLSGLAVGHGALWVMVLDLIGFPRSHRDPRPLFPPRKMYYDNGGMDGLTHPRAVTMAGDLAWARVIHRPKKYPP